ncbi:MAG: hypothetical protein RLZZ156_2620 [Deinococcota bacterium]|jgi:hypothetical protein
MNRREFLEVAALASGLAVLSPAYAQNALANNIAQAANRFLASLPSTQRQTAVFAFSSSERTRWHWTTPDAVPRNGLALTDMSTESRTLALALLRSSLSEIGYQQAVAIMALQLELGRDDLRYYFSIFGTIGTGLWGWRIEGHHLSRHFTLRGEVVGVTPFFLGASPTQTEKKLRAMPREEDAARELVRSLSSQQRSTAIFQSNSLTQHVTQNAVRVSALPPIGIAWEALSAAQQKLLEEILQTYLKTLPQGIYEAHWQKVVANRSSLRFAWAGSLEPNNQHYYRVQGKHFLLEFDNSRNSGTHLHSVWRDFANDFEATA